MPIFPPVKWLAWPPKCRRKADFSPDGPAARPGPDLKDFSLPAISGRRRRRRPFLFGGGAKEEGRMDEGSAGGLGRPGSVSHLRKMEDCRVGEFQNEEIPGWDQCLWVAAEGLGGTMGGWMLTD